MGGHGDGLGLHGGLARDGNRDGGVGGAGGAHAAGAALQQLLHVVQLGPCQVRRRTNKVKQILHGRKSGEHIIWAGSVSSKLAVRSCR